MVRVSQRPPDAGTPPFIEDHRFHDCYSLTKIIASGAFEDCSGIREVIIPESVTEINNSAFYECTGLEKVILPESLTAIWEKAFRYCRSLREIIIPPNVWHITDDVFNDCPSLKKVIVRSKVLENMYWVPDGCEVIRED